MGTTQSETSVIRGRGRWAGEGFVRSPLFPVLSRAGFVARALVYGIIGLLAFDLFNLDGILGDKFLVNGKIQPFFNVQPRRYRFRLLDTGPSRFYQFFLTDLNNLGATNPFWVIANDGNLLPAPVQVQSVRIGVAERVDVLIDFSQFAGKTISLENRLNQLYRELRLVSERREYNPRVRAALMYLAETRPASTGATSPVS